jgi:hypothetical protein
MEASLQGKVKELLRRRNLNQSKWAVKDLLSKGSPKECKWKFRLKAIRKRSLVQRAWSR